MSIALVTGGTGSIGSKVVKILMDMGHTVRVYSRDETRQHEMAQEVDGDVRFILGDVRDYQRLVGAMQGVSHVYHCAAMKHVAACEYNPFEAADVNVKGTEMVLESAKYSHVETVTILSTDKAVAPSSVLGATKMLAERMALAVQQHSNMHIVCVRLGNVLGSRGSLLPTLLKAKREHREVVLRHPEMTRFVLLPQTAAMFIVMQAVGANRGCIVFPKNMKSAYVSDIMKAVGVQYTMGKPLRGEKVHEIMMDEDEVALAVEKDDRVQIHGANPDGKVLPGTYCSQLAPMLSVGELSKMIESLSA